jgi:type II secretory pathway pseudopilin PulG
MSKNLKLSLTAVSIITAISAVAYLVLIPKLDDNPAAAKAKAQADLRAIYAFLDRYHSAHQRYPTEAEGLAVVLEADSGPAPRLPDDPWGRPYVYRHRDSGQPQIYSSGPNRIDEFMKGDDVVVPTRPPRSADK